MQKSSNQFGDYFKLPNPGLRAYFRHVEDGQPDDIRPPFWKGQTRSSVLDSWMDVIHSHSKMKAFPTLTEYEEEMAKKVGPMSIMLPLKDRMENIESYYSSIVDGGEPIKQEAIKATIDSFKLAHGVRLRNQLSTVESMRLSTNSGSPYFTKRRAVVNKTLPFTVEGETVKYPHDEYRYAAVLGWRGQEGGPEPTDVKQRDVWMFPFAINIEELRFYQPAIQAYQKHGLVSALISMDAVDKKITRLFDSKGDDYVICTDFSKFDQHFNHNLQTATAQVYAGLGVDQQWLETIYPIKFRIPLVVTENLIYEGEHGMGSGSGGTNFDEIHGHTALQHEAALEMKQLRNPYSEAYGDDGILSFKGINVDDVIRSYTRHGLEMNPSKQYVSKQDCVYLRRWHSVSYRNSQGTMVGVYPTSRALGRLLAQERFYDPEVWGPKMVTLRALSIIENSCHHPLFEEFVDFCIKGDSYKLGLKIPGFLDNIDKVGKEAIDMMPDFLGYTKTNQIDSRLGLSSWRVVQYLKSKGGKP